MECLSSKWDLGAECQGWHQTHGDMAEATRQAQTTITMNGWRIDGPT